MQGWTPADYHHRANTHTFSNDVMTYPGCQRLYITWGRCGTLQAALYEACCIPCTAWCHANYLSPGMQGRMTCDIPP